MPSDFPRHVRKSFETPPRGCRATRVPSIDGCQPPKNKASRAPVFRSFSTLVKGVGLECQNDRTIQGTGLAFHQTSLVGRQRRYSRAKPNPIGFSTPCHFRFDPGAARVKVCKSPSVLGTQNADKSLGKGQSHRLRESSPSSRSSERWLLVRSDPLAKRRFYDVRHKQTRIVWICPSFTLLSGRSGFNKLTSTGKPAPGVP